MAFPPLCKRGQDEALQELQSIWPAAASGATRRNSHLGCHNLAIRWLEFCEASSDSHNVNRKMMQI